jgi:hypothetical protein
VRIEIIIHPGGEAFPPTEEGVDAAERAAHAASGLPAPSAAALQAAERLDRDQLLVALEAAHAREHELVEQVKTIGETLRQRTIERDHFREDSLLWSLVVAKFVDDDNGELAVQRDEINAYMGKMLDARVVDGMLYITLTDRPGSSEEADRG